MNYYIITGTSKGLGESIAKKLISSDNYLFCISRTRNGELTCEAERNNCPIEYLEYDLELLEGIDHIIEKIFKNIKPSEANSICLINNAGVLDPIKPIGKCKSSDITSNMKINAIAPMVLSSQFISQTEKFECKRVIVNISSGAGKHPYFGWGCYCSSKAAIDMFTKCVGVEQVNKKNPVKIISFSPGIIDTGMQNQIRQSRVEDFTQVEKFKKFKEDRVLKEPDFVAEKVIKLIEKKEVDSGTLLDIEKLVEKC